MYNVNFKENLVNLFLFKNWFIKKYLTIYHIKNSLCFLWLYFYNLFQSTFCTYFSSKKATCNLSFNCHYRTVTVVFTTVFTLLSLSRIFQLYEGIYFAFSISFYDVLFFCSGFFCQALLSAFKHTIMLLRLYLSFLYFHYNFGKQ